jgi:hypothetical protein
MIPGFAGAATFHQPPLKLLGSSAREIGDTKYPLSIFEK